MRRAVTISIDQLYRAQPGGIGTYVRGLLQGLAQLGDPSLEVYGLAPRGSAPSSQSVMAMELVPVPLSLALLTRLWARWPVGVPRSSDVVHATSMAGPFAGGAARCVHSVALHDLLWRDEPTAATTAGIRFHERRLKLIVERDDLRVLVSSPGLGIRLAAEGIDEARLHQIRLGVDDDGTEPAKAATISTLLAAHGVAGPFTLYAGTREPRKNIERLIAAHAIARASNPEVGELVVVGSSGWGPVSTTGATVLGLVALDVLKGLYRDAALFAYVPRAEGWGLPPVEALHQGTRVIASSTTPSVQTNPEVVIVDPLDVESIAQGLLAALERPNDPGSRDRRRASVAELTWRNVALDHLAGWR